MVLPLLLILVFGIFEFGRAWNAYQVITDSTREGARVAVVDSDPPADQAKVEAVVRAALQRASLSGPAEVTVTVEGGWPGSRGDPATVSVAYQHQFIIIGRLIKLMGGRETVTLRSSTVMRKEW
jgi:Flp pilus assembly protein TadG